MAAQPSVPLSFLDTAQDVVFNLARFSTPSPRAYALMGSGILSPGRYERCRAPKSHEPAQLHAETADGLRRQIPGRRMPSNRTKISFGSCTTIEKRRKSRWAERGKVEETRKKPVKMTALGRRDSGEVLNKFNTSDYKQNLAKKRLGQSLVKDTTYLVT